MMRTFDGRVVEAFLPNGVKITGYLEKKESDKFKQHLTTYTHIFSFKDGTVVKVQANDIAIIGGADRQKFTHPSEYFLQLFCMPAERKQGVYTGELAHGLLWTKDEEGNLFQMAAQGKVRAKIAVSFDMGDMNQSPEYSQDEYFDQVRFLNLNNPGQRVPALQPGDHPADDVRSRGRLHWQTHLGRGGDR